MNVIGYFFYCKSGHCCAKLMTLLVNISLRFQTISNIRLYFLLKNCEKLLHCIAKASLIFSTKISVFSNKVVKHLTSRPGNKLKLTML